MENVLVLVANWHTRDVLNFPPASASCAPLPLLFVFYRRNDFLSGFYLTLRLNLINVSIKPKSVGVDLNLPTRNLHLLQSGLFYMPNQALHPTVIIQVLAQLIMNVLINI